MVTLIVVLNIAVLIELVVLHVMGRHVIAKVSQALARHEAAVQQHPAVQEAELRTGITFKAINSNEVRRAQ
ncbi:hypothetical protein AB0I81_34890 [Nonomuraea sp. NPDC050404]|uniref:hypothetical protein n=1 Tax=Nonomuraea sp. NPDC050404 TaxID=3155783 RepID=UPI0033D749E3